MISGGCLTRELSKVMIFMWSSIEITSLVIVPHKMRFLFFLKKKEKKGLGLRRTKTHYRLNSYFWLRYNFDYVRFIHTTRYQIT